MPLPTSANGASRTRHARLLAGGILILALGAAAVIGLTLYREGQVIPAFTTGGQRAAAGVVPAAAAADDRPVFPYSIIEGGARTVDELKQAIANDPVVAEHFKDFDLSKTRVEKLEQPRVAHVSYRMGSDVYWTQKKVVIPAGETVLTDGKNTARTRCANCLSSEAGAVSPFEPAAAVLDTPEPAFRRAELSTDGIAGPFANPPVGTMASSNPTGSSTPGSTVGGGSPRSTGGTGGPNGGGTTSSPSGTGSGTGSPGTTDELVREGLDPADATAPGPGTPGSGGSPTTDGPPAGGTTPGGSSPGGPGTSTTAPPSAGPGTPGGSSPGGPATTTTAPPSSSPGAPGGSTPGPGTSTTAPPSGGPGTGGSAPPMSGDPMLPPIGTIPMPPVDVTLPPGGGSPGPGGPGTPGPGANGPGEASIPPGETIPGDTPDETETIPEPGTTALMLLGGAYALRRLRRTPQ